MGLPTLRHPIVGVAVVGLTSNVPDRLSSSRVGLSVIMMIIFMSIF